MSSSDQTPIVAVLERKCCSLPCISQILQVQTCSFSVLSFSRTDQEFLHWSWVFSSDSVCLRSHWLFQSLRCWKMVIIKAMSATSLFMMMRGAKFPLVIAWKVSNSLGPSVVRCFSKLLSFSVHVSTWLCLFFLLFFKLWGHLQQPREQLAHHSWCGVPVTATEAVQKVLLSWKTECSSQSGGAIGNSHRRSSSPKEQMYYLHMQKKKHYMTVLSGVIGWTVP